MSALEKPNYTQFPNVLLDNMAKLSDAELRVMLCVCRQTFGYHRDRHVLSTSFIAKATGMSEQGVMNGVKRMLVSGAVKRTPSGQSFTYELKVAEENKPLNGVGGLNRKPLNGVGGQPLNGVGGNKEREKETEKNGAEAPSPEPEVGTGIPDLKAVKEYNLQRKGPAIEAEKFFDHFVSNGWKVGGKTSMKDWKAAYRNWLRNVAQYTPRGVGNYNGSRSQYVQLPGGGRNL